MSWRRQAPVLSPVPTRALLHGAGAAIGLRASAHDTVQAALRSRYQSGAVLLTDSGTSALTLALRHVARRGGTVAYPAYACIDLVTAALGAGLGVRLYDLDPTTLSPDLDSVRAVLERGVDAIVVAHLFGYPADINAVRDVAGGYGVPVIEDAAQGAGGTLNGRLLGSIGDVAILSFARGKGTTAGSGGAVLVRTTELVDWLVALGPTISARSRGTREILHLAAQCVFSHPSLYSVPASIPGLRIGEMVFRSSRPPRTMALASAAVLRCTLPRAEQHVVARRALAARLIEQAQRASKAIPVRAVAGGESGFLRLAFLDRTGAGAHRAELGVMRGYPITLDQHAETRRVLLPGECSGQGSEFLRDRLFTAPTHPRLTEADLLELSAWLRGTTNRGIRVQ